jgi:hypothetical protein
MNRRSFIPFRVTSGAVRVGALLAVAVLSLSACGGGSDSPKADSSTSSSNSSPAATTSAASGGGASPASGSDDMCRLVTKAEAESYTGKTFGDGRATSSDGPLGLVGSCVYSLPGSNGALTTIVNVIVLGDKVTADQFDAQLGSDAPEATAVDGVGEKALLVQPGILAVFDHGVAMTVEILTDSNPAATDVLVTAAKNALQRL